LSGSLGYVDQKFTNKDPIQVSATTSVVFPGTAPGDPIVIDGLTQGAGGSTACIFIERDTATYGSNQQCLTSAVQRPREIGLELNWNF
jgi:hypothetical protein